MPSAGGRSPRVALGKGRRRAAKPGARRDARARSASSPAGTTCVRPVLAERLAQALNDGLRPRCADYSARSAPPIWRPMADIAHGVFEGDATLAPGEGLALINSSAFGTALAALRSADAARLVDAADVAGALALEAFAANLSALNPAVERRPDPILTGAHAGALPRAPGRAASSGKRAPPATFRTRSRTAARASIQAVGPRRAGPCPRALLSRRAQRRAGQSARVCPRGPHPVGLCVRSRWVSPRRWTTCAIALASVLTRRRRAQSSSFSIRRGPACRPGCCPKAGPDLGLSIHAITAQALAAEASLLAHPVSFTVVSSAGAEGIEDRATTVATVCAPAGRDAPSWAKASWPSS